MRDPEEDNEEEETPLAVEVAIDFLAALYRIFHPDDEEGSIDRR